MLVKSTVDLHSQQLKHSRKHMSFHTQLLVQIIQQSAFNCVDRLLVTVILVLGCQC